MQIIPTQLSAVCTELPRPQRITGMVLWLCRNHFAEADNIESEELRTYIYERDTRDSEIWINTVGAWNAQITANKPALTVKRNDVQGQKMTIGDLTHGGINLPYDGDHYQRMMIGSHTIFCLGREDDEAELLGQEVYRLFSHWAPILRNELSLHRLDLQYLGAVGRLQESNQHFVVPVQVPWAFVDAWIINPEAPLLKQVATEINLNPYTEE